MATNRCSRSGSPGDGGTLEPILETLGESLRATGRSDARVHVLLGQARQFGRFLAAHRVRAEDVRDQDVRDFLQHVARKRGRSINCVSLPGARCALAHLRRLGIAATPERPVEPFESVLDEWRTFQLGHRGLARETVSLQSKPLARFLRFLGPDAVASRLPYLEPQRVREHILAVGPTLSRTCRRTMLSALRGFLRFALVRGYVSRDLTVAIDRERVPSWKHERLPMGPRWDDVLRLPATVDRSTAFGRRDYAILILLITYGIRTGQIVSLDLEDVDWRASTITFRATKNGRDIRAPLMTEAGEALLDYLRQGRPRGPSRAFFLASSPASRRIGNRNVYRIVARAFRAAGVTTPHWGGHAVRHAWASRSLDQGTPLKSIADLLGHRSIETTRIYAKVDFRRLRDMSLPWLREVQP